MKFKLLRPFTKKRVASKENPAPRALKPRLHSHLDAECLRLLIAQWEGAQVGGPPLASLGLELPLCSVSSFDQGKEQLSQHPEKAKQFQGLEPSLGV